MTSLRLSLSLGCCLGCLFPLPLQATTPLPYQAEVLVEQVPYRSGPGEEFYVCGSLRRGEVVEVYRQNETGYLAIRPPQRASSWVLARDIEVTDRPTIGRVLRAGVISWIDSQLPDAADDQWQVRLKEGELVEILEKQPVPGQPAETADIYYRIAPPSGEFRWVQARSVRPVRQLDSSGLAGSVERIQLAQYPQETTFLPAAGWRDRRLANINPPRLAAVEKIPVTETNSGPLTGVVNREHPQPRKPWRQLQTEVAEMLTNSYSAERFEPLHQQVEEFYQSMAGKPLREDARALLERLEEFQKSSLTPDPVPLSVSEDRRRLPKRSNPRPNNQVAGVKYDGVGWLMAVYSQDRSIPPFVLLDDDGKMLQYVTPAPGVNLRRYTRKNVGIFGTRMLPQAGKSSRLTAYRVIDLERHR